MMLQLTAPGKTFLLGEYVALQGGPTLVLTSQPCFNLTAKYSSEKTIPVIFENIAKESPAGKFLLHYADAFKGCRLSFHDPYHGLGGFGASSAQFLFVTMLKKLLQDFSLTTHYRIKELLTEYLQFAWNGEGMKPSGADLVAQAQGGISYYYKDQNKLQVLEWPFKHINYYLLHTGNKLPTHQHLKELALVTTHQLADIVFAGLQHLQTNNAQGFINSINQYAEALHALALVDAKTVGLLQNIRSRAEVLAAKGCGALGADVILVLVETKDHPLFLDWLAQQKLNLISYGNNAQAGLQIIKDVGLSL